MSAPACGPSGTIGRKRRNKTLLAVERTRAAANVPDAGAIGFVFWCDDKAGKIAKARYLSRAKDAFGIAGEGWDNPGYGLTPTIDESSTRRCGDLGLRRRTIEAAGYFMLMLQAYLGHGVYL